MGDLQSTLREYRTDISPILAPLFRISRPLELEEITDVHVTPGSRGFTLIIDGKMRYNVTRGEERTMPLTQVAKRIEKLVMTYGENHNDTLMELALQYAHHIDLVKESGISSLIAPKQFKIRYLCNPKDFVRKAAAHLFSNGDHKHLLLLRSAEDKTRLDRCVLETSPYTAEFMRAAINGEDLVFENTVHLGYR